METVMTSKPQSRAVITIAKIRCCPKVSLFYISLVLNVCVFSYHFRVKLIFFLFLLFFFYFFFYFFFRSNYLSFLQP